jgi:hypothetical protein
MFPMSSVLKYQYTVAKDEYTVFISAARKDIFESFAQKFNNKSLKGEALVAALLKPLKPGDIKKITRQKNGADSDGPGGEPAEVSYYDDGTLHTLERKKEGQLHGKDARVMNYENGKPREIEHYLNGSPKDMEGEGAYRQFDMKGRLRVQEWWDGKKPHNGPAGFQHEVFDSRGRRVVKESTTVEMQAAAQKQSSENLKKMLSDPDLVNELKRRAEKRENDAAAKVKMDKLLKKAFGPKFEIF